MKQYTRSHKSSLCMTTDTYQPVISNNKAKGTVLIIVMNKTRFTIKLIRDKYK